MRRLFLSLSGLVLLALPSIGHAEKIDSFDVRIAVGADRSIQVEESIRYDFEDEQKRGIYRDIPYVYEGGELDIEVLSVTDAGGKPLTYDVSSQGGFIRVKIGDADKYLTGQHDYEIAYRAEEAILFFDDHDELYWNATGDGWGVPIMAASAEVVFPTPATKTACYVGARGSTDSTRCSVDTIGGAVRYAVRNPNTEVDVMAGSPLIPALAPGEGLTVVAAVAKGTIIPMTEMERWLRWVGKYWPLILPLMTLATMAWLWGKKGRDPETGRHVAPMYDAPDQLSPAEVGVVWDEDADRHDISATIVDLAVRGYLTIREEEDTKLLVFKSKDYVFTRLRQPDGNLRPFETTLMEGIFDEGDEKKLSELKTKFAKTYERIRGEIFSSITKGGYFLRNPRSVRNAYYGGALGLVVAGVFLGILAQNVILGFGIGLCGVILAIFAARMPQRTMKGVEAKVHIAGLKLYLQRAEKKQIDFHNAPEKKPETFEKLLPYAMALKVEEAWAKEFTDIYHEPPSWYQSSTPGNFHLAYMMGSLNSFAHAAEASLPATPSGGAGSGSSGFGGGGFSGGGFGGGGGGSW